MADPDRSEADSGVVTRLLDDVAGGDSGAADRLLSRVYEELRRIAAHHMRSERPGQTLQTTALVHEAYLRLMGSGPPDFENRAHFFGAAGEAMRRILIEQARRRGRLRHGGGRQRIGLDAVDEAEPTVDDGQLLEIDAALRQFERIDPERAAIVKLRFFAGLTLEQAARTQGISRATASRYWDYARAWLLDALRRP